MIASKNFLITLVAGLLALAAGCTTAPVGHVGEILVGSNGMTLYTFDKDVAYSGKSACNGPCAKNWPPLTAGADDKTGGDFSIIARDDGTRQWTYRGMPLYFWAKDVKPGDTTGDGFNNVWRVAKFFRSTPLSSGY